MSKLKQKLKIVGSVSLYKRTHDLVVKLRTLYLNGEITMCDILEEKLFMPTNLPINLDLTKEGIWYTHDGCSLLRFEINEKNQLEVHLMVYDGDSWVDIERG